jgi:hypothetical protein
VEEFGTNIILINDLANWFPGETPILTEEEIKIAFYNGQPEAWKMAFTSVGENVSTMGYNEILSFMRYQENNSNYKQLRNTLNQRRLGNAGRGNGRNNQGGWNNRRPYAGRNTGNERQVRPRLEVPANADDNAQCYQHPTLLHTWGQCFLHPTLGEGNRQRAGRGG